LGELIVAVETAVPCVNVNKVPVTDTLGPGTVTIKLLPTVGETTATPAPLMVGLAADELIV
jgi:hypothetical protein